MKELLKTEKTLKQRVQLIAKKNPPDNIKAGDYVELLGTKVRQMLGAQKILDMMKKTMNVLYIQNIDPSGMMTLVPYRHSTSLKILVPKSAVRFKLTNVLESI